MLMLNINGKLMTVDNPLVMGILNLTPDSFHAASRTSGREAIARRVETILEEGGSIVDIGGYSTRPDATHVSPEEEWQRLLPALKYLSAHCPETPFSVDTFRADIARRAVQDYGAAIVNDISGGTADPEMFAAAASLNVPYVLTHLRGTPQTMQPPGYDNLVEEVMLYFAEKLRTLRLLGVNDVIIDPGFGFGKTLEQNYELMARLHEFGSMFDCPLLVGISRKSMLYKLLDCTPAESLNATTALNTFALLNGADILRVHDVRAAAEAVKIIGKLKC
jgi:dihydropteroate synthase